MEWDGRRGALRMGAVSAANRRRGGQGVVEYPWAVDVARRAGRVAMARLPRRHAPRGHGPRGRRCHNRDCCVTTPADCRLRIAQRAAMARTDEVTRDAETRRANPGHLLRQAPPTDPVARPLRWFVRQTTRAWHRTHGPATSGRGGTGPVAWTPTRTCARRFGIWTATPSARASSRTRQPIRGRVAPPTPWARPIRWSASTRVPWH